MLMRPDGTRVYLRELFASEAKAQAAFERLPAEIQAQAFVVREVKP